MGFVDLHTHTSFCDGQNTPREMVESAINLGVDTLGILTHSCVTFDPEASVDKEREQEFVEEVRNLAKEYEGKIKLLVGTERDIYTTHVSAEYDYVIGAVHYYKSEDGYIPLDITKDRLKELVEKHFSGDFYTFAEDYYKKVSTLPETCGANIIAHIDLITKFNEQGALFDTKNPRYIAAYRHAIDTLLKKDVIFEINTGAISRGYRTSPYPDSDIYEYISASGGRFILSSDAHKAENIAYLFEKYENLIEGSRFFAGTDK